MKPLLERRLMVGLPHIFSLLSSVLELLLKFGSKKLGLITVSNSRSTKNTNPWRGKVILSLSDEEFGKLVGGKAKAQQLFLSGKLKIRGDMMKATRMEPVLKKAQVKAKL